MYSYKGKKIYIFLTYLLGFEYSIYVYILEFPPHRWPKDSSNFLYDMLFMTLKSNLVDISRFSFLV